MRLPSMSWRASSTGVSGPVVMVVAVMRSRTFMIVPLLLALLRGGGSGRRHGRAALLHLRLVLLHHRVHLLHRAPHLAHPALHGAHRSEERRVGKECRSR